MSERRYPGEAPDFTNAFLWSFAMIVFMALFAIVALFGFVWMLATAWCADRLMRRISLRRR